MKKLVMFLVIGLFVSSTYSASSLPKQASINFVLANIERGDSCPALLNNANVVVDYEYNFEKNMGLAYVKKIQSTRWVEVLHPLGLTNIYGFMSDMAPKTVHLSNGDVTLYRIIFNLHHNGDAQVLMMIGSNGDCIMSSNSVNVNS